MKHTDIGYLKYWLRIHGYHPEQFGTGTKNNPIKIKTKKGGKTMK